MPVSNEAEFEELLAAALERQRRRLHEDAAACEAQKQPSSEVTERETANEPD